MHVQLNIDKVSLKNVCLFFLKMSSEDTNILIIEKEIFFTKITR